MCVLCLRIPHNARDMASPQCDRPLAKLCPFHLYEPPATDHAGLHHLVTTCQALVMQIASATGVCCVLSSAAEDVPEWLAAGPASPAAAQAGPMVLNLEDLTQSTPEVLEHELDGLTYDQLQQLKQLLDGSS